MSREKGEGATRIRVHLHGETRIRTGRLFFALQSPDKASNDIYHVACLIMGWIWGGNTPRMSLIKEEGIRIAILAGFARHGARKPRCDPA